MGSNAQDREPEHRCVCWRLAEPFVEDELPDHVCLETMVASIRSAIRDKLVPPADWWPVPTGLKKQALGLVIREWVEGAPSETLAIQLEDERVFRRQVEILRFPDLAPDADPDDAAFAAVGARLGASELG